MAGFKTMMLESSLLTEAFDSKPYEYTMGKKGAGDVFFTFEDESGKEFRVQFYTSGGLGKEVRRVYIGEKVGSVYKDAIRKFADPLRVISTVIAATEEYLRTPIGMKIKGLAFDLSKQAAPRGERVMRMVMKRSQIIKKRIDVLDSNLVIDPARTIIWTVRKGEDPAKVYNGPKVDGLLGAAQVGQTDQVRKGVSSSDDFQKEVANLLLGSAAKKSMIGSYGGIYSGYFRVDVEMDGSMKAVHEGSELAAFEPKPGETARNYAGRVMAELNTLVDKFKKGLWQKGMGRFKPDTQNSTPSGVAADIISRFGLEQTETPYLYSGELDKEIGPEWWLEVDISKNEWSLYHHDNVKAFGPINSGAIATINDAINNFNAKAGRVSREPGDKFAQALDKSGLNMLATTIKDLVAKPGYGFIPEPINGDVYNVKIMKGDYLVGQAKYDPRNVSKSVSDMRDDIDEFEDEVAPEMGDFSYTKKVAESIGFGKVSSDTWTKDLGRGFIGKVDLEHFHVMDSNKNNDYVEIYELTKNFNVDLSSIKNLLSNYSEEDDGDSSFASMVEKKLSEKFPGYDFRLVHSAASFVTVQILDGGDLVGKTSFNVLDEKSYTEQIEDIIDKHQGGLSDISEIGSIEFDDNLRSRDRAARKMLSLGMNPKEIFDELAHIGWDADWHEKSINKAVKANLIGEMEVGVSSDSYSIKAYINGNTSLVYDFEEGVIVATDIHQVSKSDYKVSELGKAVQEWSQSIISDVRSLVNAANAKLIGSSVAGLLFKANVDKELPYVEIVAKSDDEIFNGESKLVVGYRDVMDWATDLIDEYNQVHGFDEEDGESPAFLEYVELMSAHPDVEQADSVADGVYGFMAYGVTFTAEDDDGIEVQVQDDDGEVVGEFMSQGVEKDLSRVKEYSEDFE